MKQTVSPAFESTSGSPLERALFNHRRIVLILCALVTVLLGAQIFRIQLNASFDHMIPRGHPFVRNYLANRNELKRLGNSIRIAVETDGTIFDAGYMQTLQAISDDVYLLPGVDRAYMKSLWTSNTRWLAVTEDGLEGGPVIPDNYTGNSADLLQLRRNVERSSEVGQLVAPDFRSSVIFVPLLSVNTQTGKPLDYAQFSNGLDSLLAKYETPHLRLHVVGFARVVGDLIAGLRAILLFFLGAIVITGVILFWFTRCVRSTGLVIACSIVAVIWQLGLLPLLGYELDPYSVLVPFLVFAIGMSHGAQKMNGIMQDIGRGMTPLVAARFTFRRLFVAGLTALLCDAVGFGVLTIIPIAAIQDLAVIASIGVAILIFTNLILLPVLLSFTGVSARAAALSLRAEADTDGASHPLSRVLDRFTRPRVAAVTIGLCALLAVASYAISRDLKVGDLDPGAPELRPQSRYNGDADFMLHHYGASGDVFAVMVKTPPNTCATYDTVMLADALEWRLRQVQGVDSTVSLASVSRSLFAALSEGNPKWYDLPRTQGILNSILVRVPPETFNQTCSMLTVVAYLSDHKAATLSRVAAAARDFAGQNSSPSATFLLAAGNAGIAAATNEVVGRASERMLYGVYAAVALLCLVTFRSWRAVICALAPLLLTSLVCEAIMVWLQIGVKVATLPVIALGVGIGVDYALYIMSIMLTELRAGRTLSMSYHRALLFTGKVVILTGLTLAAAVSTWAFSPIKFQADMGILLAFMFVWNMVGALVLLPALAAFLLQPGRLGISFAEAGPRTAAECDAKEGHLLF